MSIQVDEKSGEKHVDPEKGTGKELADIADIDDPAFRRDTEEGVDRVYVLKAELINLCMQHEIGMGRYQWELFVLSGFGWAADNIWLQGVAIILPSIGNEFIAHKNSLPWITFALYVGLICGATTWGVLADVIGRRLSWNITLFLAGIFGISAGASPNFVALGGLVACVGFGVGGNLPVDGALFLEFIPQSHQWLLTLLSAFWSFGQLVASLISWAFLAKYSCPTAVVGGPPCLKSENMGWRYSYYTLGAMTFVMWIFRFIIFTMQESPKYLVAKGRDADAMKVLEYIAKHNGVSISLTLEKLEAVSTLVEGERVANPPLTTVQIIKRAFSRLDLSHVKPLFSTRRLAINTTITILLWGMIGLAFPLYNAFLPIYLSQHAAITGGGLNTTYRNYSIISVLGIPGSIIACIAVDWTRKGNNRFAIGGRKFAMAVSTALTGIFLFVFTTATTNSSVLGYNCVTSLTQNAMYGVLYAYTPEVFPAPHRGTGDALCSAFNRVTGLMAPIIALYANLKSHAPLYVAATLFLVTSTLMLFLPIETAGKAAL